MATKRLGNATFVTRGYGQVEPNHLSARRTGQIYAQLPADPSIEMLENGQFAKYDYAKGLVDFTGEGEWMLVMNEVKLYEDRQQYEDFAMLQENYNARVYSPIGQNESTLKTILKYGSEANREKDRDQEYEIQIPTFVESPRMPEGSTMVPRLLKTNIGDIFTTNCVMAEPASLNVGDILTPGDDGYLKVGEGDMKWAVVKVYTLADNQPAVKIQRIA